MSLLLIHLSDLHAHENGNPAEAKWEHFCRAATAEASDVEACVIVFNGDAAYGGKPAEFAVAARLLEQLVRAIRKAGVAEVHLLCVPGNHDCDLTSEDQAARHALRANVGAARPPASIEQTLLAVQKAYFEFAEKLPLPSASPSAASPYYVWHDIVVGARRVRFHLLNSAWTSVIGERDDLGFPVEAFDPPAEPEADYAVTVLHHPTHWFAMPAVRKQLRARIEQTSDLVLTGHEHDDERSRRSVTVGPAVDYEEGGVLQEHRDDARCVFRTFRIDFGSGTVVPRSHRWQNDHFEPANPDEATSIEHNPLRSDRRFRWTDVFEERLDELQDPLTHRNARDLRLSQLFVYPDLRKIADLAAEGDGNDAPGQLIDRVKGDDAAAELLTQRRALVTGGEKYGKTSLGRQLVLGLRRDGQVPVLLAGSDLGKSGSPEGLRKRIDAAIVQQYAELSPAAFEQLPQERKAAVVDDFDDGPQDPAARARVLEYLGGRFGTVILLAGDELLVEMLGQRGSDAAALLPYQRYEVCEFLHLRLEALAMRWAKLGRNAADSDAAEVKARVRELCEGVETMLALAGMPHTPYLLCAVMAELDDVGAAEPDLALKNGNYGPLYAAAITRALSLSDWAAFDLSGKETYLSEIAAELYRRDAPTLGDADAQRFHAEYRKRFPGHDFDRVIEDLEQCRVLRRDGGQVSFRHKYVYCYFVAQWFARNLRHPKLGEEARKGILELGRSLHHDVSANILVFLAHASRDPEILRIVREAAAVQFASATPAAMGEEVTKLNELAGVDGFFVLPPSPPDINRKLIQDAEDERRARGEQPSQDGRRVRARPDEEDETKDAAVAAQRRKLREVRAAIRTLRILGQIARNGATSMELDELRELMREVVDLGRRVLGELYEYLENLDPMIRELKHRCFAYMLRAKREALAAAGGNEKISLVERKRLARKADLAARRYWFDLYWLATLGIVKRLSHSIGLKALDPVLADLRAADDTLPHRLIELQVQFGRRGKHVPADDMVRLHKELVGAKNKLGRVVLEAMTFERLLLHDTAFAQMQQVCQQMGIKMPKKALDQSRKKFLPRHAAGAKK